MGRRPLVALGVGLIGCGLRSDPLFAGRSGGTATDGATESESDSGPSACEAPQAMPLQNLVVRGRLEGRGTERGWCGGDAGPEAVYEFVPASNIDVNLAVLEADGPLTLRVQADGCAQGEGETVVCATDFVEQPRHFLAQAGHTYSIIVDTELDTPNGFAVDMVLGWPTLDQCAPHDEVIVQNPGATFTWRNDFPRGQGRVDGVCGGPGRENMFAIDIRYPGYVYAFVEAFDGLAPVLSVRTDCAGVSELACQSGAANEGVSLEWFIEDPSMTYYLAVDQVGYDGGGYALSVYFE